MASKEHDVTGRLVQKCLNQKSFNESLIQWLMMSSNINIESHRNYENNMYNFVITIPVIMAKVRLLQIYVTCNRRLYDWHCPEYPIVIQNLLPLVTNIIISISSLCRVIRWNQTQVKEIVVICCQNDWNFWYSKWRNIHQATSMPSKHTSATSSLRSVRQSSQGRSKWRQKFSGSRWT